MLKARWQRLEDDSWGLRITGFPQPQEGDAVEVQKASGESTTETVGEILWRSGAVTVARYKPQSRTQVYRRIRDVHDFHGFHSDDEYRGYDE